MFRVARLRIEVSMCVCRCEVWFIRGLSCEYVLLNEQFPLSFTSLNKVTVEPSFKGTRSACNASLPVQLMVPSTLLTRYYLCNGGLRIQRQNILLLPFIMVLMLGIHEKDILRFMVFVMR